ncbi:hypothetical protein PK98_07300 [Croceibacterium mercuriale]|uniref:Uncharacterized protein n=1 Tax=Croceibacterium mercuriale TaxID=1572751 RepID=A0A0B2C2B1_9SPHN|nr:hypothetical protein [Croceibacterium mercuriale]KHL26270.1 hypothetical protein PK98_07300 [Croceibacterium mercuriale]
MNAFDAARTSAGETGLAGLLATTTAPANGQGAHDPAAGATPFAQLLDQLSALPVPQDMATPVAQPMAQGPSLAIPRLPAQQLRQTFDAQASPQDEQASIRIPALDCALPRQVTGKMVPAAVMHGTILPADPATEVPRDEATGMNEARPPSDQPVEMMEHDVSALPSLATAQLAAAAAPLWIAAQAAPVRAPGGGFLQAGQSMSRESAVPAAASPASTPAPAAPAVTLIAADLPATRPGGSAAVADEPRDLVVAMAPGRPTMPVPTDLHGLAASAEPRAAAPQVGLAQQPPAMQDLTQIVERLAAAREAAAPAATQLAVDHAEFGPLSLSIRQGECGELAIAVAAADRDSQVALVAAIAQGEAPAFEQAPDRRGGDPAGREPATASQHGEQRGQGGQRDRLAGQQQQRQPMPQRRPAQERDGETRTGTYA